MSPTAMLTLLFAAIAMFAWSASRRWKLLQIGLPAAAATGSITWARASRGTWRFAFRQEKMDYYNRPGSPTSSSSSGSSSSSCAR